MTRLIFDTETTGLADFKLPPDHPSQPRMIQLAGVIIDDAWKELSSFAFYIEREDFDVPANSTALTGIDNDTLDRYGVPLRTALSVFTNLSRKAEPWAFNAAFDSLIIKRELHHIGKSDCIPDFKPHCAMLRCKDIVKIPAVRGYGGYKFPKLSEAYAFFFDGATFENAHDALGDVRATARVMEATDFYLKKN